MSAAGEPGPAAAPAIRLHPAAKLNLTLEVLGRRGDGYHALVSILQAVDLRDELALWPTADPDELRLECSAPDLAGEGNLVLRAARLLRAAAGVRRGARLRLEKRIPVAAGLGGGSADAAAALLGLARLWELRGSEWPRERLAALAAELGSDVAFFLGGPTALAAGRGERVAALPPLPPHLALIVRPALQRPPPPDKTRRLYAALQPADYLDGRRTRRLADALRAGAPLDPALLVNSFERAARSLFPEVAPAAAALRAAAGRDVHLAGSGPCLFALFASQPGSAELATAGTARDELHAAGLDVWLVRTLAEPLA